MIEENYLKNMNYIKEIFADEMIFELEETAVVQLSPETLKNLKKHKRMISALKKIGSKNIKEWHDNTTDNVYLEISF